MPEQATIGAKAPSRIKTLLVKELTDKWQGMDAFVVVCPIGLDAIASNELRGTLQEKNIRLLVVKNALAKLAFEELKLAPAAELLDQCSAVCYGGESVVDVAREVVGFSKKFEVFQVRGAFLEGKVFSAEQVGSLAIMPNRTELIGQIVQLATGPGGRLVSVLFSPASRLAGAIKALTEKLAKQSENAPSPEPAAQAETEQAPAKEDEDNAQARDAAQSDQAAKTEKTPEAKEAAEPEDTAEAKDAAEQKDAPESLSDSASEQQPPEQQQ